jgi:hypothetical protein
MEVIGAASSVITLIQLVSVIKKAVKICSQYQAADIEFQRISKQIKNLTTELEVLKWAGECGISLQESERAALETELSYAREQISEVEKFCREYTPENISRHKRLRWSLGDKRIWKDHCSRLSRAQISVNFSVQIFNMYDPDSLNLNHS